MKIIGRGWQYTTYDVGNGRVFKKYNSLPVAYIIMLRDCFPYKRNKLWKLPGYYKGCKETARDSMNKISNTKVEKWMLGNPKVLNELDYEQDKVIPIHQYFKEVNIAKGKQVIDQFVEFNKLLVGCSFIDKSFNITKNFAIDKNERIILLDLGELFSSEDGIKKQIERKMWQLPYVVNPIPAPLKSYFLESMDNEFTSSHTDR